MTVYHRGLMRLLFSLFVTVAACGVAACSPSSQADAGSSAETGGATTSQASRATPPLQASRTAEPGGYKGVLPAIPTSPHAGAPPDVVRAVYEFAARRPDVLRHVPCFCGCERNGHQDNEDCFVARRDADGRPHFDSHGLT